jgi:hypothetical protein
MTFGTDCMDWVLTLWEDMALEAIGRLLPEAEPARETERSSARRARRAHHPLRTSATGARTHRACIAVRPPLRVRSRHVRLPSQ